jgi:hypothetical protein
MRPYRLFRPDRYVRLFPRLFLSICNQVDTRKQPELRASTYARTGAFFPHARRSRGVRRIQSPVRCLVVCIRLHYCLARLRKSPMQAATVDIAEPASRLSRLYTPLSPVATVSSTPLLGQLYSMQMQHALRKTCGLCENCCETIGDRSAFRCTTTL